MTFHNISGASPPAVGSFSAADLRSSPAMKSAEITLQLRDSLAEYPLVVSLREVSVSERPHAP